MDAQTERKVYTTLFLFCFCSDRGVTSFFNKTIIEGVCFLDEMQNKPTKGLAALRAEPKLLKQMGVNQSMWHLHQEEYLVKIKLNISYCNNNVRCQVRCNKPEKNISNGEPRVSMLSNLYYKSSEGIMQKRENI